MAEQKITEEELGIIEDSYRRHIIHKLVDAYRAQQTTIDAQAAEIAALKAHTMRLESSLRASEDLYAQQAEKLAQAEADKERPYAEIRMLNQTVLKQMDTITQLKARDAALVRDNPPRKTVTVDELREALGHAYGLYGPNILPLLRDKGLLIEDAHRTLTEMRKDQINILKNAEQERIYGVDVPPADQIPVMEVKAGEVDPLKVNMREQPHNWYEEMLARKHNALTREFREVLQYQISENCRLEGKIAALEEKVDAFSRRSSGMTDQPNPYEPFKPPFELINSGNFIQDSESVFVCRLFELDSPIGQHIVDLLNRDSEQSQPLPDLEPVRKLIEAIERVAPVRITPKEIDSWRIMDQAAVDALPTLKSLLAEVERLCEENARMQRAITKTAEEGLSHAEM